MTIYLLIVLILNAMMPSGKMPSPPGTKMVADNLYLDENLINLLDYNIFLSSSKARPGKNKIDYSQINIDYSQCSPDTNILLLGIPYMKSEYYDQYYAILNLTDYQIKAFCTWRSYFVNFIKNNPNKKLRYGKYWKSFDKADPEHLLEVEYFPADSATINFYNPAKQVDVPEMHRINNTSTIEYTKKYFGTSEIFSFRCAARYISRK